jgi:hypothetical protein
MESQVGRKKTIGVAGSVVKIVALPGAGAVLIVTIYEAVAVIVEANVTDFGGGLGRRNDGKQTNTGENKNKAGDFLKQSKSIYAHKRGGLWFGPGEKRFAEAYRLHGQPVNEWFENEIMARSMP